MLRDGAVFPLTEHEVALLAYMAERPGEAISRDVLLAEVWGYAPSVRSRAVDQTVKRLRPKLEPNPAKPQHLCTVHGVGYRLDGLRAPESIDRFVGRDDDLARLEESHGAHRWVTVLGPGGIGKTRLCREWRARGWVDLSASRSADDVLRAVSAAVELPALREGEAPEPALDRWLSRQSRPLLLLDNAEQVAGPLRQLGERWLARHPTLRVVATSRHRVAVRGEAVLELAPLSLDAARELLLARVSQIGGHWEEGEAVDAIVQRLDGIPLAIELAAARGRLLDASGLSRRLAESFSVLRSRRQDRHGALRTAIEWSWTLLDEEDRQALVQLTVFASQFTVEAAEAVLDDLDALDRLQGLRDRSWLRAVGERLGFLEPIREFVAEHRQGMTAAEDRHAGWVLGEARDKRRPHPAPGWIIEPAMAPWTNDLLAVVERMEERRPDVAAEAALALHAIWVGRESAEVCAALLDRALRVAQDPTLRAELRLQRGHDPLAIATEIEQMETSLLHFRVQFQHAKQLWREGVDAEAPYIRAEELAEQLGQPMRLWQVRPERARALACRGLRAEATALLASGLSHKDQRVRASMHYTLGFIALEYGDIDDSEMHFERALELGNRDMLLGLLAIVAYARRDFVKATALLEESHRWTLASRNRAFIAEDRAEFIYLEHVSGRVAEAVPRYAAARDALDDCGMGRLSVALLAYEAVGRSQLGDHAAAQRLLDALRERSQGYDGRLLVLGVSAALTGDREALLEAAPPQRLPVVVRRLGWLRGEAW